MIVAGVIGSAFLLLILLAVWRDRLPLLPYPLGISVLTFAAAGLLLYWVRLGIAVQPTLAAILLAAFTTLDLAYHNGPTLASALPPSTYAVLEPTTNNATIAILKSRVVDDDKRRDRIELTGLGFHWPNASLTHSLENTLGYNPLRLRLYSEATGAEDHVGLPDQRKFSPLFPSYRSKLAALLGLRFIAAGAPIDTIDTQAETGRPAAGGAHQRRLHLREPQHLRPGAVRNRRADPPISTACSRMANGRTSTSRRRCCSRRPRLPAPRRRGPARPGSRATAIPRSSWRPTAPTAAGWS